MDGDGMEEFMSAHEHLCKYSVRLWECQCTVRLLFLQCRAFTSPLWKLDEIVLAEKPLIRKPVYTLGRAASSRPPKLQEPMTEYNLYSYLWLQFDRILGKI